MKAIRDLYGDRPEPLADVPPEHHDQARRMVELWSGASRSMLQTLGRTLSSNPPDEWRMQVYRRILAGIALTGRSDRLRLRALEELARLDPRVMEMVR